MANKLKQRIPLCVPSTLIYNSINYIIIFLSYDNCLYTLKAIEWWNIIFINDVKYY